MSISISIPSFIKYYNVKELGQFHFFFFFFVNLHRLMVNGIRQSLGLDLVYINVYTIFIKILRMKLEFGPGSFFRIFTSAKPRPITIDIPQYLVLELVNINAYAFFCFKIFHTVREIGLVSFFLNLDVGKASTNGK